MVHLLHRATTEVMRILERDDIALGEGCVRREITHHLGLEIQLLHGLKEVYVPRGPNRDHVAVIGELAHRDGVVPLPTLVARYVQVEHLVQRRRLAARGTLAIVLHKRDEGLLVTHEAITDEARRLRPWLVRDRTHMERHDHRLFPLCAFRGAMLPIYAAVLGRRNEQLVIGTVSHAGGQPRPLRWLSSTMRGCQGLGAAALLAAGALANTEMVRVDPSLCAPETNELVRQGPWYVGGRH